MAQPPTKTFGLNTPRDLYAKLLHDIERVRDARVSDEARYSAFDCAVTAWHMADWVWHALDDASRRRLCAGKDPTFPNFLDAIKPRLKALEYCQQIANSAKHVVIRNDRQDVSTHSSVVFNPPFNVMQPDTWSKSEVSPMVFIKIGGQRHQVLDLFEHMAEQWDDFLTQEGLGRDKT